MRGAQLIDFELNFLNATAGRLDLGADISKVSYRGQDLHRLSSTASIAPVVPLPRCQVMVKKSLLSPSVFVMVSDEVKQCDLCQKDDLAANSGHRIALQVLGILVYWLPSE